MLSYSTALCAEKHASPANRRDFHTGQPALDNATRRAKTQGETGKQNPNPPVPLPGESKWEPFFVKGDDGKYQLAGAKSVLPGEWSFTEDGVLCGVHSKSQGRDGLVISTKDYDNFIARVTYRMHGGNIAMYFRAEETSAPWVLRGFQNEIANNGKDSALWHTAGIVDGKMVPGRGWVVTNDEFAEKVRNKDDQWNTTCTAAYGDRLVQTLNGFCTSDIVDEACEKKGKLGLQMHGGADCEMFFKDLEVMPIAEDMMKLIERK